MSFIANLRDRILDRFFQPTNAQMLTSAADHGVDLTQPISVTFYIAFRLSDDADRVANLLASKGYSIVRETEEEDPHPFEIEAEVLIPGNEQEIERHEVFLRGLAKEFSARYDDYSISYTDEGTVIY